MSKIFLVFYFLCVIFTSSAQNVKIVAIVGTEVITSVDLQNKIALIKQIDPDFQKTGSANENAALERLIQEELLFTLAKNNGFELTDKELQSSIKDAATVNSNINKIKKSSILYPYLLNQIKSEVIFGAFLQSRIKDKLNFSKDEIERFKNSYNANNDKKINNAQSKQLLTSMKINEVQYQLLEELKDNQMIEKK